MKKTVGILVGILVVFAFAADFNLDARKMNRRSWEMYKDGGASDRSDTVGVNTGNSKFLYADSTADTKQGFKAEDFEGDSISFLTWGYYDGDETSLQIRIDESPNGGLTWYDVSTDTLTCTAAAVEQNRSTVKKYNDCQYRAVFTCYGTTDSMSVEGCIITGVE